VLERVINDSLVSYLLEAKAVGKALSRDYYTALQAVFTSPSVVGTYSTDYHCLIHLRPYLSLLWSVAERQLHLPRSAGLSISKDKRQWRVVVSATRSSPDKYEAHKEEIIQLFTIVQRIQHGLRMLGRGGEQDEEVVQVRRAFTALMRLPLLNRMACVPAGSAALHPEWTLEMEARSGEIHVPMIEIHLLRWGRFFKNN